MIDVFDRNLGALGAKTLLPPLTSSDLIPFIPVGNGVVVFDAMLHGL
jgi:hypothetical protein